MDIEKDYSGLAQSAIILFYAAVIIAVLIAPIITGVSIGVPQTKMRYALQATILQGGGGHLRSPMN